MSEIFSPWENKIKTEPNVKNIKLSYEWSDDCDFFQAENTKKKNVINQSSKNLISDLNNRLYGKTEVLEWDIVYTVKKWDSLWNIAKNIVWYSEDWDILKKTNDIKLLNNLTSDRIFPWMQLKLWIITEVEMDMYIAKEQLLSICSNKQVLKNIEIDNQNKLKKNRSTQEGIPLINWSNNIDELWWKLSLDLYSWELNSDAYEIYSNMKDTRWTQKIGQYRNSNWKIEDIILWDNKWKNIYMELNKSYRFDDIDSWRIDSISSQEELEDVMKGLLKIYEKENREDY